MEPDFEINQYPQHFRVTASKVTSVDSIIGNWVLLVRKHVVGDLTQLVRVQFTTPFFIRDLNTIQVYLLSFCVSVSSPPAAQRTENAEGVQALGWKLTGFREP